jgi:Putative restriction endonuclease
VPIVVAQLPQLQSLKSIATPLTITWERLPQDFVLPDDPVDNMNQPTLAAALTESLELAGLLPEQALTPTNYGICANVNGQTIVKAPDWAYIPAIRGTRDTVLMSYTPNLQGEPLAIALEFVSATDGGEYSMNPRYPYGKWFFYEQILAVPFYGIFEPQSGDLELYRLEDGRYRRLLMDEQSHYWIPSMNLAIGAWQGLRENRPGYWLRWWNAAGEMLPWRLELVAAERDRADEERDRADEERDRADEERDRADRLAAKLRELGIDPSAV